MTAPTETDEPRCGVVELSLDATVSAACGAPGDPVGASAGLVLCRRHLLLAHEAVLGEVGVTDPLPSPCIACGSRLGVRYPSGWLCAVCEWRHGEIPDDDVAPVRVDVVYYLASRGLVKIGTSSNPRARLAQIAHEELLAFERGGRALEQRRHREFAACRAGREWFERAPELLEHIEGLRAEQVDPWELHARWRSEALARRG
ncbi:GIY-YIG nuclease family protein [Herbiconiux sp. A18JL235]|uniref:GIY-YIG nuclease family protein n=1 Tax=Herbiconiux sp. A18JL235 TaxID=3152363 RepID=A0AB39BKX9_9MICO